MDESAPARYKVRMTPAPQIRSKQERNPCRLPRDTIASVLIIAVLIGLLVPSSAGAAVIGSHHATRSMTGLPPLKVVGNRLETLGGRRVILRGVDRSGSEYACIQGWGNLRRSQR